MIHTEVVANENPQDMLYTIIQQQQEALHRYAERDDASTKAIDYKNRFIEKLVQIYNLISDVYSNPVISELARRVQRIKDVDPELDSVQIMLPLKLKDIYSNTGYLNFLER